MKTLRERITDDGIHIIFENPDGTGDDLSELVAEPTPTSGAKWKVCLKHHNHGGLLWVDFGNSIAAGLDQPDVNEVVLGLVGNAIPFLNSEPFPEWGRNYYGLSVRDFEDSVSLWNFVERAYTSYVENEEKTRELMEWLGPDRLRTYAFETEFDV
ncbi:hypothetical protein FDA94_28725 [Herbidospora galbida]|uniref:Uncharacterized protein n=1 Tax=Herbidospora galbida TaxID=2575442 RepID=A0A4U3MAL6_9ACTN|nr:hypothetical protein [Herbidospora galbida]TKK84616.1 hypothetical protein FDA94_28725 [Herbidospora galbida]